MSFSQELQTWYESKIYRLVYEKETVGFRAKYYNVKERRFDYYDFTTETLSQDKEATKFIKSNIKKFEVIRLIYNKDNDSFLSQEEINGSIQVREFKDINSALEIIKPLIDIYMITSRYGKLQPQQ